MHGVRLLTNEIDKRISDKFWSELQTAWNNASAIPGIIGAFADNFNQQLGAAFSQIGSQIQGWIDTNIVQPINGFVKLITVKASEIWGQITTGAAAISSQVTTWIKTNITDPINKFKDNITAKARQIWDAMTAGTSLIGTVMTWLNTNIVDPINKLYNNITEQAGSIIQKLLNGDYVGQIVSWAKGVGAKIASEVLAAVRSNPIGAAILDALGIGGGSNTGGGTGIGGQGVGKLTGAIGSGQAGGAPGKSTTIGAGKLDI